MSELSYMKGTEGNPDYLIVALNGGIALGVKGVILPLPPGAGTLLGARVRASPYSGQSLQLTEIAALPTSDTDKGPLAGAWPDIPFEKVAPSRASLMCGVTINKTVFQIEEIKTHFEGLRVGRKVCEWVMRRVMSQYRVVEPADISAHIDNQIKAVLEEFTTVDGEFEKFAEVQTAKEIQENLEIVQGKKTKGYSTITGGGKGPHKAKSQPYQMNTEEMEQLIKSTAVLIGAPDPGSKLEVIKGLVISGGPKNLPQLQNMVVQALYKVLDVPDKPGAEKVTSLAEAKAKKENGKPKKGKTKIPESSNGDDDPAPAG